MAYLLKKYREENGRYVKEGDKRVNIMITYGVYKYVDLVGRENGCEIGKCLREQ